MKKAMTIFLACLTALLVSSANQSSYAQPSANAAQTFTAFLTGDQEVPAVDTDAFGVAVFTYLPRQNAIRYVVATSPMPDVTQAHIHLAPAGQNGGVVAWLFGEPGNIPPTATAGLLATGVITENDLVGQLTGEPLSVLLDHMRADNAYVNVHTTAYPPGEIRGQIGAVGP